MAQHANPRSRKITIVDIAKAAGVSHATVSRVLNKRGYTSPETREKVLGIAERLGYVANAPARSLAGAETMLLGVVTPHFLGAFHGFIAQVIDQELAKEGYNLAIFPTDSRGEKEAWYIHKVINGLVDGLVIMLPLRLSHYLPLLRRSPFAYVLIDSERADPDSATISMTDWQGAYDATRHLIELGHRRIAHLFGRSERPTAYDRLAGYRAALTDSDLPFDPALVQHGEFTLSSSCSATKTLMALPNPPTAIFAANDQAAFGTLDALQALGLRVPEDVSVVGFDDLPEAEKIGLTTVHVPMDLIGRLAARALIERIRNPEAPPRRVTVATALAIRKTTAPPRSN